MELLGNIITYIIMACCLAGAIAAALRPESGLAASFHEGLSTMAALFVPVVGPMVALPYLATGIPMIFGGVFGIIGADPTIAAASFLGVDAGGYALSMQIASSPEIVAMAMCVSIMTASTIAFNIPVGISLLKKEDYRYLALGTMSGVLSIPFAIFSACLILDITKPMVRTEFSATAPAIHQLNMNMGEVLINLIPITFLCILLVLGLKFFPKAMVKIFIGLGRIILGTMTIIAAIAIVEHNTGIFSSIFKNWNFNPIMADGIDNFRAIEVLGTIAMMLSGAFPMVYLIRKYFGKQLAKIGRIAGLDEVGSASLIAGMANAVALFKMIGEMRPSSKVIALAFVVCGGFAIGDWFAFNVNFQPNLVVPIFLGQMIGGIIGIIFAKIIAVPKVKAEDEAYIVK